MARYIALIDGKPGAYGVAFPDCPGCTAMSGTVDEALSLATEALREWMADRISAGFEAPAPRSFTEMQKDAEFMEQVRDGAVLASVSLLLDAGRSVRANLSFDAGLLEAIDDAAKIRGITRSAFLASAAREKITAER